MLDYLLFNLKNNSLNKFDANELQLKSMKDALNDSMCALRPKQRTLRKTGKIAYSYLTGVNLFPPEPIIPARTYFFPPEHQNVNKY